MEQKHAYLIMAHGEWALLSKLLQMLDDPRNDIYIHIDIKADFNQNKIYQPTRAGCRYVPRMDVAWGGDSLVKCELGLMEAAAPGHYAYYHLLSGVDLPLRSQDEIHSFFAEHYGTNYIKIDHAAVDSGSALNRVRYYRWFQNKTGRKTGIYVRFLNFIEHISLYIQRCLHMDRLRYCPKKIYKGSNWFSITDEMMQTILAQKPFIKKYFYHSLAPDELFVQTVAMNSELKDTIADEYLRYIDWERGAPYTFRSEDFEELMNSNAYFARKFSDQVDADISNRIFQEVTKHG